MEARVRKTYNANKAMGDRIQFSHWFVVTSALLCWAVVFSKPKDVLPSNEVINQPCEITENKPIDSNETSLAVECVCNMPYLCDNSTIENSNIANRSEICENYVEECCPVFKINDDISEVPRSSCGFRNEGGLGLRIAVGNDADFGEFPWMIMILKKIDENLSAYLCGGSLIHPQVVLTAAHCVMKEKQKLLKARGGEWNTENSEENLPYQDRNIEQVILHEFNRGTGFNDIALLVLDEAFVRLDNMGVICLPGQDDVILDKDCIATGWGLNSLNKAGTYQNILKKVSLSMVSRDICEASRKLGREDYKLHESLVCAVGVNGSDTCKGDGGSPLVCPIKNGQDGQYQQVGIVSWGDGCGTSNPGLYANVAHFVTWIDSQMAKLGFQPSYYY